MNLPRRLAFPFILLTASSIFPFPVRAQSQIVGAAKSQPAVPQGARVTLQTDRDTFFLGENILAHFGVENIGTLDFTISSGGDYRGAARSMRFIVTAQDAAGKAVRDPYPFTANFGGLFGTRTLKPKQQWFHTLPLIRYLRFEAPGQYRIRARHDLGWRVAPELLPVAEAQIELVMPSREQAEAVIAAMEAAPKNRGVTMGQKNPYPQADFSALNYPVYLPLLLARIDAGKLEFLESVRGIETPDATRALVERLQGSRTIAHIVAKVLAERLPVFYPDSLSVWPKTRDALQQRQNLVKASWRDEFVLPTRQYARRALESDYRPALLTAASMVENIGTAEDLAPVMAALDRRIEMTAQTPRWHEEGDSVIDQNEGGQLQGDCHLLIRSGRALLNRGAVLPTDGAGSSRLSAIALQINTDRTAQATKSASFDAKWLRHPNAFIRQLALQSLTPIHFSPTPPQIVLTPQVHALLPALLQDPDTGVRAAACDLAGKSRDESLLPAVLNVLSTARNSWLIGNANEAARLLGGQYQVWTMWASRLDEKEMMRFAIPELAKVLSGKISSYSWNKNLEAGEGPLLKTRWQNFLRDNRARLQAGELFSPSEASWSRDLLPKAFTDYS